MSNGRDTKSDSKFVDMYNKQILEGGIKLINEGQNTVKVDFSKALEAFPRQSNGASEPVSSSVVERRQRERLQAVEMFMAIMMERTERLRKRLADSAAQWNTVNNVEETVNSGMVNIKSERLTEIRNQAQIAESTALNSINDEIVESPLTLSLGARVDQLLIKVDRVGSIQQQQQQQLPKLTATEQRKEQQYAADRVVYDPSYTCFLQPLHETIKRISSVYNSKNKGPLSNTRGVPTSDADLQLMTITDLSRSVLDSSSTSSKKMLYENVPSSIVPGLCQQCAMMITNVHEATHISPHSFNFENKDPEAADRNVERCHFIQ
ncbi:WSSV082 [White spot syndrome virus]|uniref:WSSV082 n=1 Tax=White spot syndrome virus TaxID=342409 RepID=A0A2I6SBK3_9VIRU|nr:WSSV082 [White spot syndrome virus]